MVKFASFRSLFITLGLSVVLVNSGLAQATAPDGEEIVRTMAQSYAGAESYQDTGVVRSLSANGETEIGEGIAFKTYFARPKQLRFEWRRIKKQLELPPPFSWPDEPLHVVWSDGKDTFRYWEPFLVDWLNPVEKVDDLSLGIAGETGVSGGSAHTIPTLLLRRG